MINVIELKELGANIARIRSQKNISQEKLAFDANIGSRTLSRIEVGESDAKFTTLSKIAQALGVQIKELVDF